MSRTVVVLSLAASVILGACGGGSSDGADTGSGDPADDVPSVAVPTELFSSDFEQVCAGGTIAAAPEYDKKSKGLHPMLAFSGKAPEYDEMVLDFPEGWVTEFGTTGTTELVACLGRTAEEPVKTCKGYEDDETGETFEVELYNADYAVTLYAAHSGEEVASTELKVEDDECPFIVFFDEGEKTQIQYADPDDFLKAFVKPYVAG